LGQNEINHIIVLVHGTFARGAEWTHPDSKLASRVRSALPGNVLVIPFEWSGRNSHGARISGGAELSERLSQLRSSHPGASLHLIAHSHGGNVAAYALRESRIRDSLAGVVCLGTPFVAPRPRALKPTLRLLDICTTTISVFAMLLCLFLAWIVFTVALYPMNVSMPLVGSQFFLAAGGVCLLIMRFGMNMRRQLENRFAPRLRDLQDDIIAWLHATFHGVPVLNIQVRRDEAAGYLHFIERIANVPFRVWSPTILAWAIGAITILFILLFTYVMLESKDWHDAPLEAFGGLLFSFALYSATVVLLVLVATTVAQLVCIFWAKIFRGHALAFGEEGFLKNWLVAISAASQPPDADRLRNEFVSVAGGGLRHSLLYEDNSVIGLIVNWLGAYAGQREALPDNVRSSRW
jgi:hypothetical protein